jgi:hypothetical protein
LPFDIRLSMTPWVLSRLKKAAAAASLRAVFFMMYLFPLPTTDGFGVNLTAAG